MRVQIKPTVLAPALTETASNVSTFSPEAIKKTCLEKELRQQWRTPEIFLQAVRRNFGDPTIDVAALPENRVCERFISPEEDGLRATWFRQLDFLGEIAWCNPGFRDMAKWIDKAAYEIKKAENATALVLGLAAPSTKWFRRALDADAIVYLLSPRVQYETPEAGLVKRSSNPRECALFVFRTNVKVLVDQIVLWNWKEAEIVSGAEL